MEFSGIELHNVRELVYNEESGGYKFSRMPMRVAEFMANETYFSATGCELRFVPIDDEVTVKIRLSQESKVAMAAVYYGSHQAGWRMGMKVIGNEITEITVPKSPNAEILKKISAEYGYAFSPEVVRIVLPSGCHHEIYEVIGKCRPPMPSELPKKKYLAYGSSITHGSLARHVSDSYAVRLSENFGCDYLNLGFAGSARLEREVADYIANECEFDFCTLEMGINVLNMDPEEFRERVEYFISTVAKAHPDKKIFCIDIFYMEEDVLYPGDPNSRPNIKRKIVKETVEKFSLSNTVYIPGLEILNGANWLSEDLVHPNARGVEELARNLTAKIKEYI